MNYCLFIDTLNHTVLYRVQGVAVADAVRRFISWDSTDLEPQAEDDQTPIDPASTVDAAALRMLRKHYGPCAIRIEVAPEREDRGTVQQLFCSADQVNEVPTENMPAYLAAKHFQLGLIYSSRSDPQRAMGQFTAALELVPGDERISARLASTYLDLDMYLPAITLLLRLVEGSAGLVPSYESSLGDAYKAIGKHAQAVAHYRNYLSEEFPDEAEDNEYARSVRQYIERPNPLQSEPDSAEAN